MTQWILQGAARGGGGNRWEQAWPWKCIVGCQYVSGKGEVLAAVLRNSCGQNTNERKYWISFWLCWLVRHNFLNTALKTERIFNCAKVSQLVLNIGEVVILKYRPQWMTNQKMKWKTYLFEILSPAWRQSIRFRANLYMKNNLPLRAS